MKMWIARDYDGGLYLFPEKPTLMTDYKCWAGEDWYKYWDGEDWYKIGQDLFPEVTFENSPQKVELVLPSQEPTIGDLLEQLIETKKEMRKFREMVSRMRDVQKTYTSYESVFGKAAKEDLICKEADVDKWLRETEETEFDD